MSTEFEIHETRIPVVEKREYIRKLMEKVVKSKTGCACLENWKDYFVDEVSLYNTITRSFRHAGYIVSVSIIGNKIQVYEVEASEHFNIMESMRCVKKVRIAKVPEVSVVNGRAKKGLYQLHTEKTPSDISRSGMNRKVS